MTGTEVKAIKPRLMRVRQGWLAVSEEGAALVIGVQADTEGEATRRFHQSLETWAALLDDPTVSSR